MHHVELNSGTSKSMQVSKKSFYTFEDIDLWESHAKVHKKPSETLGMLAEFMILKNLAYRNTELSQYKIIAISFERTGRKTNLNLKRSK